MNITLYQTLSFSMIYFGLCNWLQIYYLLGRLIKSGNKTAEVDGKGLLPKLRKVMGDVQMVDPKQEPELLTTSFKLLKGMLGHGGDPRNWQDPKKGAALITNSYIRTGNGRAVIEFEDGTKFVVRENSELRVIHGGLQLDNGAVLFEFKKEGKKIILKEKRGKYSILGTKFSLEVNDSYTVLKVIEGTVNAQSNDGKSNSIVSAGQTLELTDNQFSAPQNFRPTEEENYWKEIEQKALTDKPKVKTGSIPIPTPVLTFILGAIFILGIVMVFKNKIIGLILIIIPVAFIGYLFAVLNNGASTQKTLPAPTNSAPNPSPTLIPTKIPISPSASPSSILTVNPDWISYSNKNLGLSLKHPPNIKPEELEVNSVVFQLWGPTQRNDTEFYDGVNISIETRPLGNMTLEDKVEEFRRGSIEIWGDSEVGDKKPVSWGRFDGYSYQASSHMYYYLKTDNRNYLEILNLSGDPGNLGFVTTSLEIIRSVRKL